MGSPKVGIMGCGSFLLVTGLLLVGLDLQGLEATGLPEQHSEGGLDYPYADSYAQDFSTNWDILSGRHSQAKCIDIPQNLSLCRNIGYNQMRLPNLLDHDTVSEVVQQASSWVPLLGIRCHADTKLFLCSLFSPVCLDRPIWPCRSLCNSVKTSCISFMSKYGFPWPDMLRCDKFPLDNDLCIGLQNEQKEDDRVCEPCSKPDTYESIVHNYCTSGFVVRMGISSSLIVGEEMKLVPGRRKKFMKKGTMRRRDVRSLAVYIGNGRSCECPAVNSSLAARQYLVMGRMQGGKAMVNFITVFNKRSKEMKKAMRALKKADICKSAIAAITGDSDDVTTADTTSLSPTTTGRRGGRKRNRKGGRNRERNGRRNRNRNEERAERRRNKRRNRESG